MQTLLYLLYSEKLESPPRRTAFADYFTSAVDFEFRRNIYGREGVVVVKASATIVWVWRGGGGGRQSDLLRVTYFVHLQLGKFHEKRSRVCEGQIPNF